MEAHCYSPTRYEHAAPVSVAGSCVWTSSGGYYLYLGIQKCFQMSLTERCYKRKTKASRAERAGEK